MSLHDVHQAYYVVQLIHLFNDVLSQGMTNFIWYCRQVDEKLPTLLNGALNITASSVPYSDAQLDGGALNMTSLGRCFRQGAGLMKNNGEGSMTFSGRNMRINDTYVFCHSHQGKS